MPESRITLAKSTDRRDPVRSFRGPRCVHLYAEGAVVGRARRAPLHRHEFWQIDAVASGVSWVLIGSQTRELPPGHGVLIPPRVEHGFRHAAGCRMFSIKFQADGEGLPWRVLDLSASARTRALFEALAALVAPPPAPAPGTEAAIDAALSALVEACYFPAAAEREEPPLAREVRGHLLHEGGRYVTVGDVARRQKLSISRTSARFREETGSSLKSFLDRERGRLALQLVTFSDLTFKQIADRMGFKDPAAFSRFFRRLHGTTARAIRARGPLKPRDRRCASRL